MRSLLRHAPRWAWARLMRHLLIAALVLPSLGARAHEMSMAEMNVREMDPGVFLWQWTPTEKFPVAGEIDIDWPSGCKVDANMLRCGADGLRGTLTAQGVGQHFSAAMIKVAWLDGQSRVYTLTKAQRSVQLYGSAEDQRGMGDIASAYTLLGVEHILSGYDHLLFVLGLLFLVGFNKRLIWTITAFTAAHSLTLASAALGLLTLRSPPVEASIALSIMLVAGEALRQQPTLSRRWPALVAFLFGLVHGLGFAGALQEIGLPKNHLLVALVTFNVGVELGQLLTVGAAWAVVRALSRLSWFTSARRPALYAIGTLAAYWSWWRVAAIFANA
ncbi:HupE/UreJ family protein [Aquabacterium sp.]|uniref:HupE/UreJ family protein n=1 Tax=Aquabacterium sp. TaxID=1872578 RepID=UPI0035ADA921